MKKYILIIPILLLSVVGWGQQLGNSLVVTQPTQVTGLGGLVHSSNMVNYDSAYIWRILNNKILAWYDTSFKTGNYYIDKVPGQFREAITHNGINGKIFNGNYIEFNGTTQYLGTNGYIPLTLRPVNNSITISVWFKISSKPTANQTIVGTTNATYNGSYEIRIDTSGTVRFAVRADSIRTLYNNIYVCDGKWHNAIAIINKTSKAKLYVDRVSTNFSPDKLSNLTFQDYNYNLYIGGFSGYGTKAIGVRNLRILNRGISTKSSIDSLYENKVMGSCVAWWPMEGIHKSDINSTYSYKSGIVLDASGNNNHLFAYKLTSGSYKTDYIKSLSNIYGYSGALIGNDLVQGDGTFDNSSLWTFSATRWAISGGQATFNASASYQLVNKRTISFSTNTIIRMSFDVVSGTAKIKPINSTIQTLGEYPSSPYTVGHHDVIFCPDHSGTLIGIYADATGGAFVLDNLTFTFYYTSPVPALLSQNIPSTDIFGNSLIFNNRAKLTALFNSDSIKLPDCFEINQFYNYDSTNVWLNSGTPLYLKWSDINTQPGLIYKSGDQLILIDPNNQLTKSQDIAIQKYLKTSVIYNDNYIPIQRSPMFAFTSDDGQIENYTNLYPLLNEYGFKGGYGIVTKNIGAVGYMTAANLLEMENNGHEIMSHSITHANLAAISLDSAIVEMSQSKNTLIGIGLSIYNFAYPGGTSTISVRRQSANYYEAALDITGVASLPIYLDKIPRAGVDGSTLVSLKEVVDDIIIANGNACIIFYGHAHNWDSTHLQVIDDLFAYIASKGYAIVTPKQIIDKIKTYTIPVEYLIE